MGTDNDRHFIEHMVWDEVARRIANGAAAILPIGAARQAAWFPPASQYRPHPGRSLRK